MPLLPATTARAILQGFEALGLDGGALRAEAGLDAAALAAVDGALPSECFTALWREAFRQAPREELPTELGFAVPFGAFGAVDYLASSSATVQSAFHSLQVHFRRVGSMRLELLEGPEGATVQVLNATPFEGVHLSDELTLALFVARFRLKSRGQGFTPRRVRLSREAPARPTRHPLLLGAPVQFGCRLAALELSPETWAAPLPDADPGLQLTLRQLAGQLELGATGSDLELALRARLRAALPEGDAEATSAARALGLSERTLHRRLHELGTTWRVVLDGFREAEAERLLAAGGVPLGELALRLGFSDQTAFNRAFKRWKARSPTQWLRSR